MHTHYLQHVPFEGLGSIADWLQSENHSVTRTTLYDQPVFPDPTGVDFLIIMGGPMSIHDELQFPWLVQEKDFIRSFLATGKPTLGICLGAQLIANSLGSRVFPNHHKEIGWFSIETCAELPSCAFRFPPELEVFHWHGETFDLPPESIHLAQSQGCRHQGFQVGSNIMGLQFHLETTADSAMGFVENCREELIPGRFVQTEQQILSAKPEMYRQINGVMNELLAFLIDR